MEGESKRDIEINYYDLAKAVSMAHKKIAGAIIVRKGSLLAAAARPGMPMPEKSKLTELILQAELIVNISKRNSDIFGEVEVLFVQHRMLSVMVVPLSPEVTLALAVEGKVASDYEYADLTKEIFQLINDSK